MSFKQASAHVQYNGFISNNFAISQEVGQGRVISAWFFSLYINDLISELKAVNSGISISVSPSRTEISESFCLCPSNNIKQLFVPLYVRRQRQA
jgi:hypothetical protein